MIGLISATAAGAAARDRLAAAWPDRTRVYEGPVKDAVRTAFAQCEQLVCFLATGAVVRLVAPLLGDKASDPGVVCVDEGGRFAVSLLGGHGGGANELALEVGELLGAEPVVTTATDAVGIPGLDMLGLPVEGDVAGVTRALLDGEPVALDAEVSWPLPPLPFAAQGTHTVRLTDRAVEPADSEVLLRPPSLVVGVGASRGAPADEVLALVEDALRDAGLSPRSVAWLATVDAKREEPGIVEAAARLGVPVMTYSAQELTGVEVPNPSEAPLSAVGTPPSPRPPRSYGAVNSSSPSGSRHARTGMPRWRPAPSYDVPRAAGSRSSGSAPAPAICSPRAPRPNCGAPPCSWASTSTSTRSVTCCGPAPGSWSPGWAPRRSGRGPRWPRPGRGRPSR